MAIGIMILSLCPGGPTSNLITQVARGNIGLSVTLTALASLITVFTIPIILSKAITYFTGETDIVIELPIVQTMIQILVITVIPVSIGMLIRKKNEAFAETLSKISKNGNTMECRLYAEDPKKNFLPSPGKISKLRFPEVSKDIRIDIGVGEGDEISFYYDPMIAKIICKGNSRTDVIRKMTDFLQSMQIEGIKTNKEFLIEVLKNKLTFFFIYSINSK